MQDKIYPKGLVSNRSDKDLDAALMQSPNDDSYVEMLEQQQNKLVLGLQELYALLVTGAGWKGSPLRESTNGHPLTHDILERLGVLRLDANVGSEAFEEDLDLLRQKLAEETDSSISNRRALKGSDPRSQISFSGLPSPRSYLSDSFHTLHHLPPTPPIHSPHEEMQSSLSPVDPLNQTEDHRGMDPSVLHSKRPPVVHHQSTTYDDGLDFLNFDLPPNFDTTSSVQDSTSSCLSFSPWLHDDLTQFESKEIDT